MHWVRELPLVSLDFQADDPAADEGRHSADERYLVLAPSRLDRAADPATATRGHHPRLELIAEAGARQADGGQPVSTTDQET